MSYDKNCIPKRYLGTLRLIKYPHAHNGFIGVSEDLKIRDSTLSSDRNCMPRVEYVTPH